MKLSQLLTEAGIVYDQKKIKDETINKISIHSKNIEQASLFVALVGYTNDGHHYIEEAIEKGCKTIVFEDAYYALNDYGVNMIHVKDTKKALAKLACVFYQYPSKQLNLIGVTGTNGKTTISTIIHNLYGLLGRPATVIGTNGITIGKAHQAAVNTTPSSPEIQKVLRASVDEGIDTAILEVSSHGVKEQRIGQLDFKGMIFTNFSLDHLDYHHTVDDYFYNKALSFAYLGNGERDKFVLINGDDDHAKRFINVSQVPCYTYGLREHHDFRASRVRCTLDEISFDFVHQNQALGRFKTKELFGFYNVYNLLAALSYFYLMGEDMEALIPCVKSLSKVTGRFEKVKTTFPIHAFVDFAHTPKGVYKLLQEVKLITATPIVTVIGCGGNRDRAKRPLIGKIATSLSDITIFTDDNPRDEDSQKILSEITRGVVNNHFITIANRREAIDYAIHTAGVNDTVLILGKGHETTQIIHGVHHYFNDYEVAEQAINKRFMEE